VVHLPLWINYKNLAQRHFYGTIADCIGISVSEPSIEGLKTVWEKLPYIAETGDLENFGFL
jgi:hypothetical protein